MSNPVLNFINRTQTAQPVDPGNTPQGPQDSTPLPTLRLPGMKINPIESQDAGSPVMGVPGSPSGATQLPSMGSKPTVQVPVQETPAPAPVKEEPAVLPVVEKKAPEPVVEAKAIPALETLMNAPESFNSISDFMDTTETVPAEAVEHPEVEAVEKPEPVEPPVVEVPAPVEEVKTAAPKLPFLKLGNSGPIPKGIPGLSVEQEGIPGLNVSDTPKAPGLLASMKNPFGQGPVGKYKIELTADATEEQRAIANSGKDIESMSQDELRGVYFMINAGHAAQHIYSASTINHIAKTGRHPSEEDKEFNKTEWTFIGNGVHNAVETKGKSLKKLFHFGNIGEVPVKPETSLSKDHQDMMREMIVNGLSSVEAYIKVKDNLTTKSIELAWLVENFQFPCITERAEKEHIVTLLTERYDDVVAGNSVELTEDELNLTNAKLTKKLLTDVKNAEKELKAVKDSEEYKAVLKVSKAASTEYDKFKDELPAFKSYLNKQVEYEKQKVLIRERAEKSGGVLIDDIPYVASGKRCYESIGKIYGAFENSSEAFNVFHPDGVSSNTFEMFSEYVVLFEYTLSTGRKALFKSMMDRYIIDHTSKVAWVLDLKTYGKPGNFLHGNYKDHAYWRSMAVYYEAIRVDLERRGLEGYIIQCSLLPISMVSLEVGSYGVHLLNLSNEEIKMGTNGGYMKFMGSIFNEYRQVCTAISPEQMELFVKLGMISNNSPEFRVRGWKQVVDDFEVKISGVMPKNQAVCSA